MKGFLQKYFSYSYISIAVFIILNPLSFAFADIIFPKYFFSSEIRSDCFMVGYHGDNSFKNKGTLLKLDLTDDDNRTYLKDLKYRLNQSKTKSTLFDTKVFAENLENIYMKLIKNL